MNHPDPIPTPWDDDKLKKAHEFREYILSTITRNTTPTTELLDALLYAKNMELKLTQYESRYNDALTELQELIKEE